MSLADITTNSTIGNASVTTGMAYGRARSTVVPAVPHGGRTCCTNAAAVIAYDWGDPSLDPDAAWCFCAGDPSVTPIVVTPLPDDLTASIPARVDMAEGQASIQSVSSWG